MSYSHSLADFAQSGQMFGVRAARACACPDACVADTQLRTRPGVGVPPAPQQQESLQKLSLKRDPRTETLWCVLRSSCG
jgi:hypothetical protein